ncbi:replication-relaxation family protein [Streptomyces longisporoflavus]|uniref:Replication-relaxation family protein n=1 Tax=Streptomyces longisporoflavus TaxID=28044 RepID=A0ABW7R321_9ACTN
MSAAETPTPHTPAPHEPLPHQLLSALAQHRMATTSQLREILRPGTARQTLSTPLNKLRHKGLVDYTVLPRSNRTRAWYLTADGARLTRDLPELRGRPPYPITSASAASLKTPHTLTVVRTHLAFATDARRLGHEHGPWDWTPEVSHPLGEGERLVADALMHYSLARPDGGSTKLRAFIEVDRSTMSSERMAAKLIEYARFHRYQPSPAGRRTLTPAEGPAWMRWYPLFPRVLFILTNASRRTLANRTTDLRSMADIHPAVTDLARHVPLGAAVLEDLEQHGPTAAVWTPLTGNPEPLPWTDL